MADALAQAVRCQDARAAVATVDSVLHLGMLTWEEVRDVLQRRDRQRDLAAARLGLFTLRPLAEDLLYDRPTVLAAVRGIVTAHHRR